MQDGLVCTALSHDIIAHETTHALLDGLRSSFHATRPTWTCRPFTKAFADLVALFLHFTYADVVEQAIRESRGGFTRGSLLSDLAGNSATRDRSPAKRRRSDPASTCEGLAAFDSDVLPTDKGGPRVYDASLEPHALGSVLVSAVFEAFTTVVKRKTERFFRIAGLDLGASARRR